MEISGSVDALSDLVQGKLGSYLSLYGKMVIGLVAKPTTMEREEVPETLLLDASRLVRAHIEFNCIVDRIAVLTQAAASISSSSPNQSHERRMALSSLSFALVEDVSPELDTEAAITLFVSASDHQGGERVAAMMRKGVVKDDPVRKLM